MFKKQGTSKRSGSISIGDIKPGFDEATPIDRSSQASAFDMAWASEEQELSEEELATVVGGYGVNIQQQFRIAFQRALSQGYTPVMSWEELKRRYPGIQSRSGF